MRHDEVAEALRALYTSVERLTFWTQLLVVVVIAWAFIDLATSGAAGRPQGATEPTDAEPRPPGDR